MYQSNSKYKIKERKDEYLRNRKDKIKRVLILFTIFCMNGLNFMNAVYATAISSANLYSTGDCGQLLKYKGAVVKVSYVQYTNDGVDYPAYCMDKTKPRSRNRKL